MRVQHIGKPGEPYATPGQVGEVSWYKVGASKTYTIKPSGRGIPAMAYVNWGEFFTWEKIKDLRFL